MEEAARRGLLGGDVDRHLVHSLAFVACVRDVLAAEGPTDHSAPRADRARSGRLTDIGSGAGVPGLVLATEFPDARVTLVERREGRATWLEEAAGVLAREGVAVEVCCADVYDLAHGAARGRSDVVTARAFGSPAATAELGGALLRVGGVLVVSEPPDRTDRWRAVDLAGLGLTDAGSVEQNDVRFQLVRREVAPDDRFPRRQARGPRG